MLSRADQVPDVDRSRESLGIGYFDDWELAAIRRRLRTMKPIGVYLLSLSLLVVASCGSPASETSMQVDAAGVDSARPTSTLSSAEQRTLGDDVNALDLSSGSWELLPEILPPRSNALGVWTGSEAMVIGGDPKAWCPPNADCTAPDFTQMSDGAAFDPVTNLWRRIAEAPVPVGHWASTAVVGDQVYVRVPAAFTADSETGPSFLQYDIADDEWTVHPDPGESHEWYRLVPIGDRLIAYTASDELGEQPDLLLDPETMTWTDLPPDPLSPSFDRFMVADGDKVTLFAKDIVASPGSEGPSLARIAEFQMSTDTWEVVGESKVLWTESGVRAGEALVFPWSGEADGGQVNNWGRSYPNGGIYDLTNRTWTDLPEPARADSFEVAGVIAGEHAAFKAPTGSVLDLERSEWLDLPPLPDAELQITGQTVIAMGQSLLVFGGEYWTDGSGTQTAAAYAISPGR